MELHDGFIVGIYNYCDRWCETCAFTARCRVFADRVEIEAAADPNLRPVTEAPPLPAGKKEEPPPPPPWLQELIDDASHAARQPLTKAELERLLPSLRSEHREIESRARSYCVRAVRWLDTRGYDAARNPADPRTVIGWYAMFLPPKIYRALTGFAAGWPHLDCPPDYDGSAKAALIAIERSHVAWLTLIERRLATMADVSVFVGDLVWLGEELERVFPNARAFVRPGFDEPEEIAKLS